jgi:hypothetical protein
MSRPAASATTSIPFIYRLVITTIEPLFATMGAILAFTAPENYLSTMTRGSVPFSAGTTFLYTELGGAWLYFAFVEAVVFRLFDDANLWRLLCAGMLLSDFAYGHSAAQAVGGWGVWFKISDWTAEDWTVFWTTAPMVSVKILTVLGVGVRTPKAAGKRS